MRVLRHCNEDDIFKFKSMAVLPLAAAALLSSSVTAAVPPSQAPEHNTAFQHRSQIMMVLIIILFYYGLSGVSTTRGIMENMRGVQVPSEIHMEWKPFCCSLYRKYIRKQQGAWRRQKSCSATHLDPVEFRSNTTLIIYP